jgi:hypothetical protein
MSKSSSIYLETTEVSALKSIGEITDALVRAGARSIETLYENGRPLGLAWSMWLYDRAVYFRMPAKIDPVYKFLRKRKSGYVGPQLEQKIREQAERVAWRQMLAWVKVQLTLTELGMVEYAQVFLPYVQEGPGGRTMWEAAQESHFRMLEAPKQ